MNEPILSKVIFQKKETKGTVVYTDGERITIYVPKELLNQPYPKGISITLDYVKGGELE